MQTQGRVQSPADLNGVASVVTYLRKGRTLIVIPTTVVDADEGVIELNFGTDTEYDWLPSRPATGEWLVEYEVTWADVNGTKLSWPNGGSGDAYDVLPVYDDLDPAPT